MTRNPLYIRMHPADNVAIVANDGGLPAGAVFADGLTLVDKVPQGHKVALVDLAEGDAVLRYNVVIGYAAKDPDLIKVVGEPFSVEKYGIGLAKGDDALREHINTLLTDGGDTWQAIFDKNLGESGITVEQPEVDNY